MHAFKSIYSVHPHWQPIPAGRVQQVRAPLLFYIPDYASPTLEIVISLKAYEAAGEREYICYDSETRSFHHTEHPRVDRIIAFLFYVLIMICNSDS